MTDPFVTYTRTRQETTAVAEVTEANIGQIAAVCGGQVDYSGDAPVLIVPGDRSWRVKIGYHVARLGDRLQNMNGFNRDGDWTPATTDAAS